MTESIGLNSLLLSFALATKTRIGAVLLYSINDSRFSLSMTIMTPPVIGATPPNPGMLMPHINSRLLVKGTFVSDHALFEHLLKERVSITLPLPRVVEYLI